MTRDEVKLLVMGVKAVFQSRFEVTPELLDMWQAVLGAQSYADGQQAVLVFLSGDNKFPPLPGEINQIIAKRNQAEIPLGVEVWEQCVSFARQGRGDGYVRGQFADNNRALSAIRAVGWDRIRYADLETELPFVRKDFIAYYDRMVEYDGERQMLLTSDEARGVLKSLASQTGLESIGKLLSTESVK